MIKLNLLETIDLMQGQHFSFGQNTIYIGNSKNCHISLNDTQLDSFHILIFESENSFFIKSDSATYHLNGKRTKGIRNLKINDQFKIGQHLFKVEALEKGNSPQLFANKEALYKKAITEDPEVDLLLEKIESELIEIEERITRDN